MQSPSSSSPHLAWIQLLLILAAIGLCFILWVGNQTAPQTLHAHIAAPAHAKQKKRLAPPPRVRVLPTRTISAYPKSRTSVRKKPVVRTATQSFFYPLPFDLQFEKRAKFYATQFEAAKHVKMQIHEKLFLKVIHRERVHESKFQRYRTDAVRLAAIRYVSYRGVQRFRLLGFRELQQFEKHLKQYLALGGSTTQIPAASTPAGALAAKMVVWGGYFPILLRNLKVAPNAKKLTKHQHFWMRTLFMARWSRYAMGHLPLSRLMSSELYLDYTKARLLFSRNPKRRLWAVRELGAIAPQIPTLRILGWLLVQLKKPKMAKRSFRDALKKKPKDALTRTLLDKLLKSPS